MPDLTRTDLGVLTTGAQVQNRSCIFIETAQNADCQLPTPGPACRRYSHRLHSHLSRLRFDADISRLDQLWLVLSPPLDRPFDPILRIGHLPL